MTWETIGMLVHWSVAESDITWMANTRGSEGFVRRAMATSEES